MRTSTVFKAYRSIRKAKASPCPALTPEQEAKAKIVFDKMSRTHDFMKPTITVDGKTEPAERMTMNECRWVVYEQTK